MSEDGGDMTSDVCETLIELLEDRSKPVHIHIVSALLSVKRRAIICMCSIESLTGFSVRRLWGCFTYLLIQHILFSHRCWQM